MPHYKYLIIGSGMTGDAAIGGIRQVDKDGAIGVIGIETDPPYNRPPLSKALWKGKPLESAFRTKTDRSGVAFHQGRTATTLDVHKKTVTDDQGMSYTYDKLLLATGGTPRHLPFGGDNIIYYRTLEDYRDLRALTENKQRFAIIGGGFIGSEVAAALAMNGKQVTMVFPEEGIGAAVYPHDLSQFLNNYYRQKGVEVLSGELVQGMDVSGGQMTLKTKSGRSITADSVIAGIGIQPNVQLAEAAGLRVQNGIVVDEHLLTSAPDVYAAGDVAAFYSPTLATRMRVEHEDNANTMGKTAGLSMAGQSVAYNYLPFFYSDLFELGYEAVGELDARSEIVADWKEQFKKGVIYYIKQGRVRGVLLWDTWDTVDKARALIAEPGPFNADNLKGRLP
jgi:3-phenylpropionate/trans-cinnamate dioxygenase ferredoxin reductase component